MKLKKSILFSFISIAQAGMLVAGTPAFAAGFTANQMAQVEHAERVLFGNKRSNLSDEARLRAVETNLFGKHKTGSVSSRLDGVKNLIGDTQSSYLMPPMAATFDTGNSSISEAPDLVDNSSYSSPQDSDLLEAMQKYSSGDMQGAKRLFEQVAQKNPDNVDAFFNLGVIAEGEGDIEGALSNYKKAQRINPGDSELAQTVNSLENRINSERQAKYREQQERSAEARQKQDLEQMKSVVADASRDYKAGNYDAAVRKLEGVAAKAPSDPDIQFALGQAHKAKGNLHEAKIAFNRASSIDPNSQLFRGALQDVNNEIASSNRANSAPAYTPSPVADATPAGQITPFTPTPQMNSSESRGIARVFSGSRLKRTIAGGAVGAASGAIWSATTKRSIKSGALKGALTGAIIGFMAGN